MTFQRDQFAKSQRFKEQLTDKKSSTPLHPVRHLYVLSGGAGLSVASKNFKKTKTSQIARPNGNRFD
jgi:hypothetical protein